MKPGAKIGKMFLEMACQVLLRRKGEGRQQKAEGRKQKAESEGEPLMGTDETQIGAKRRSVVRC